LVRLEKYNVTRNVSMAARKELIEAVGTRYRERGVRQRSAILDEFVAITGLIATAGLRALADRVHLPHSTVSPAHRVFSHVPSIRAMVARNSSNPTGL
jgi:hypothetical protein